jgi:hypothetical protein
MQMLEIVGLFMSISAAFGRMDEQSKTALHRYTTVRAEAVVGISKAVSK